MYCNACAAQNPDGARFCSACAAPLPASAPTMSDQATQAYAAPPSMSDAPTQRDTRTPNSEAPAGGLQGFVGSQVAGYQIEKKLGEGGMGSVYLATQLKLQRRVAIKVLPPQFSRDRSLLERFEREARAVATLDSPYIVPVHDMFEARGLYCIAMGYADGGSVRDLKRKKRRLDEAEAADLIRQAALGLWKAAEQGIVHRDIKPDNLLLTSDGRVKIADFGLAKALDGSSNLTRSGAAMGTPHYMSPEQCRDTATADHRADLYSLGCTLFELLTGRPPFKASSAMNLMLKQTTEAAPDVRSVRPELSEGIAKVVRKLLEKDPDARFQTGAALAEALAPSVVLPETGPPEPPPLPAPPPLPRRKSRAGLLVAVLLGIALVAGLGYGLVEGWGSASAGTGGDSTEAASESAEVATLPPRERWEQLRERVAEARMRAEERARGQATEALELAGRLGSLAAWLAEQERFRDAGSALEQALATLEQVPAATVFPSGQLILPEGKVDLALRERILKDELLTEEHIEYFERASLSLIKWTHGQPEKSPGPVTAEAAFGPLLDLELWERTGLSGRDFLAIFVRVDSMALLYDRERLREGELALRRQRELVATGELSEVDFEQAIRDFRLLHDILRSAPPETQKMYEAHAGLFEELLSALARLP